jgi:hypothetical protein
VLGGDSRLLGPLAQGSGLARRVDDRPLDPPGQGAVDDLQAVRAPEVEPQPLGDRVEDLVEPAGDDADQAAVGVQARDELGDARRDPDL